MLITRLSHYNALFNNSVTSIISKQTNNHSLQIMQFIYLYIQTLCLYACDAFISLSVCLSLFQIFFFFHYCLWWLPMPRLRSFADYLCLSLQYASKLKWECVCVCVCVFRSKIQLLLFKVIPLLIWPLPIFYWKPVICCDLSDWCLPPYVYISK